MSRLAGLVIMFIIVMIFCSSIRKKPPLAAGDICIISNDEGDFGVVKILYMDQHKVHVKVYANKFASIPLKLDVQNLTMKNDDSENALEGIPHLVVDQANFREWAPQYLNNESVSDTEMEACLNWRRQQG